MPPAARDRRGKPLYSLSTIINLIGSTTTGTGLNAHCIRDTNENPTGLRIRNPEMAALDIRRADFHGDRNCTLLPASDRIAAVPGQTLDPVGPVFSRPESAS